MRFFIEIAYNGLSFSGWQKQANSTGIQQVIEEAFSHILKHEISIQGSGRTDAGVHATQQFFHLDTDLPINSEWYLHRFNGILPDTIQVKNIFQVQENAHARFQAYERSYQYRIVQRRNPFLQGLTLFYSKALNLEAMNQAASMLVAEHPVSFKSFSKIQTSVNNFDCVVTNAAWKWQYPDIYGPVLVFEITANRFLRGMVRALVGTLLEVGEGQRSPENIREILQEEDRESAGPSVAPHGLYLRSVKYPREIFKDPIGMI